MTDFTQRRHSVSGDYDINLTIAGPEDGRPIILLHGSGPGASGLSNFRGNFGAFSDAGFRVIMPDLIGYGGSSKPEGIDYTLQLFADSVYEAVRAEGIDQAVLVGNSLGGGISLQITLDHPEFVQSLVLMAPGCIEELATYFAMPGIGLMAQAFSAPEFTIESQRAVVKALVHPDFLPQISEELVQERFAVARTQPKDVLMRMRTLNLTPRLGEIRQPMLVMWGSEDKFCPETGVFHFFEAGCDVRSMRFAGVGHWVQVERREEFNRHVLAFLAGIEA